MDFKISKLKSSARIANKTEPSEWQTSQRKRHTPYFSVCKFFFLLLFRFCFVSMKFTSEKKGMNFVQSKVIWSKSVLCKSMCLCVSCACKSQCGVCMYTRAKTQIIQGYRNYIQLSLIFFFGYFLNGFRCVCRFGWVLLALAYKAKILPTS